MFDSLILSEHPYPKISLGLVPVQRKSYTFSIADWLLIGIEGCIAPRNRKAAVSFHSMAVNVKRVEGIALGRGDRQKGSNHSINLTFPNQDQQMIGGKRGNMETGLFLTVHDSLGEVNWEAVANPGLVCAKEEDDIG